VTQPGALTSQPAFMALKNRVDMLERRASQALSTAAIAAASAAASGTTTSAKRFRIGVFTVPLTVLGAQVSGSVKWSTPITNQLGQLVDAYNVDAACSAMPNTALVPTLSAQTSAGVTVSFTAPVLLAAGTIVVVLGIAPAAPS